jgi:hypothetical protein
MRKRQYAVDDVDFEQYQSQGGTMTLAEFFNAKLTGKPVTDSLKMRLMDQIGVRPEQSGQSLTQRITLKLQG